MDDLKFKSKIKKLVDIKLKLESIMQTISREKLVANDHFLGEVIFDVTSILNDLDEFQGFHVYEILQRVLEVFHNIKNKSTKLTKNLYHVIFHLLEVGLQQVLMLQDLVENKMIAMQSIQVLDQELNRNNKLISFMSRPLELPSLTFRNIEKLEKKSKEELIKHAPKTNNLSIDTEKFDLLMNNYKEIIHYKNQLVLNKSDEMSKLYKNINEFSILYEELNLIPIQNSMDSVMSNVHEYLEHKDIELTINCFWGKARFAYFKIEILEKFVQNVFELIIDYIEHNESKTVMEVKSNLDNSFLTLSLRSRFYDLTLEELVKSSNDHRINYFYKLLNVLNASFDVKKIDDAISIFEVKFPIRSEVASAYLITTSGTDYFLLEDDVVSFHMIEHKNISVINAIPTYSKDNIEIAVINYLDCYDEYKDQFIIFCKLDGNDIAIIVDEIHNKEQVTINNDFVMYKNEKVTLLGHNNLLSLNNRVLPIKEIA